MLSIEITRECPLSCPGCYAYGDAHLGGEKTLRQLADLRDDALVGGVLALAKRHDPIHVSIVGGEPLMRRRELDRILPALSAKGIYVLVVTSGVIPIPAEWMDLPRLRVAVSVDGLPEHHNPRRMPATYEKILRNIEGRQVNIHLTVTAPMLERSTYLDEYMAFWSARPEVCRIWFSVYTPQKGESSPEMLSQEQRRQLIRQLPELGRKFPAFVMAPGIAQAFASPPASPSECLFSRMSVNYSADLDTRVEPCVFGGEPDCEQCGCAISAGMHWLSGLHAGPVRVSHFVGASTSIGRLVSRLRVAEPKNARWHPGLSHTDQEKLVQISR
jgi:MoaA/NifB/PqqE/SkfB family radical SAM enzyme